MAEQSHERLRENPASRFAALQHLFNLEQSASELAHEAQSGEEGHRQQTLYKHGGTTVALFLFGQLSRLPPHRTNGIVVIHVLKGHLRITAESQTHDLRGGQLLVLADRLEVGIVAREESTILLTVHLETESVSQHADAAIPGVITNPVEPAAGAPASSPEPGASAAVTCWDNEGGHGPDEIPTANR